MKTFGKRLAVLVVVLCIAVSGAIIGVVGSKALEPKPDFSIMVISDLHVFEEEHVGNFSEDYLAFDAARTGRVEYLAESIFRNALDRIVKASPDAVLIPGDLVDVATLSTHKKVAGYLKEVEQEESNHYRNRHAETNDYWRTDISQKEDSHNEYQQEADGKVILQVRDSIIQ